MVETILKMMDNMPFGGTITMSPGLFQKIEEVGMNINLVVVDNLRTAECEPMIHGQYIHLDNTFPENRVQIDYPQ